MVARARERVSAGPARSRRGSGSRPPRRGRRRGRSLDRAGLDEAELLGRQDQFRGEERPSHRGALGRRPEGTRHRGRQGGHGQNARPRPGGQGPQVAAEHVAPAGRGELRVQRRPARRAQMQDVPRLQPKAQAVPGLAERHRRRHAVEDREQDRVGQPVEPQQRGRAAVGLHDQARPAGDKRGAEQQACPQRLRRGRRGAPGGRAGGRAARGRASRHRKVRAVTPPGARLADLRGHRLRERDADRLLEFKVAAAFDADAQGAVGQRGDPAGVEVEETDRLHGQHPLVGYEVAEGDLVEQGELGQPVGDGVHGLGNVRGEQVTDVVAGQQRPRGGDRVAGGWRGMRLRQRRRDGRRAGHAG